METQAEKVYVAIGTDRQDGFGTLEWALKNWSSHSISIVILYAANNANKDYVYTPFGKLPASSVSDEKLKVLRKIEEGEIDKLLSKYIAFCGKVKAEFLKIEKYDEPIQKVMVELIWRLRITKLVMGITFMKSSSCKSRSAISGSFYVFRQKPDFCGLFIICGGKLVFLREENNEEFIEDDQGVMVAKVRERPTFKGWLGKMFAESATHEKNPGTSPSSSTSNDSPYQWENYVQEIENYFEQLLSSNADEEDPEMEDDILQTSPPEPDMPENMSAAEKTRALNNKICKVHEVIHLKRKEAMANVERHARAEWAICLCTRRAEELEARINEEMANRVDLSKELDTAKEELYEIQSEVEENKNKLNSILELQRELSNKLQSSSLAKSRAEAQVEKAVTKRADMVREIEELRRQRDVLQRRIEFCREKDAIGMATRSSGLGFNYKEFTAEEIRAATDDFSERLRLKSAGDWTNVYKGRINHTTVAIKLYDSVNVLSQEAFQSKVKLLSHIRHPHLISVIGFCSEPKCIILEYMHNGCLRDALFSAQRSSKRGSRGLNWHARIRIAAEVCSGLGFLHLAQPKAIVHGNLNPSKILLDCNLVAKIHGFRLDLCYNESDVLSDMRAFGNLLLQLLTGRNWAGLVEEAIVMDHEALIGVLDEMAGDWPLELAVELAGIAMRCLSTDEGPATVMREIDKVRKKADDLVAGGECEVAIDGGVDMQDSSNVPSVFLCPIFQDVMKNPHVAADGFSYELVAIEEWLGTGHDTSPMTNLKLSHKLLTPNHTLRSLIHDWHSKRSIPLE
uniref:RING-type E3 ubiquitin transferase n=1 Tax=Davidia involucrata TaxID=16924 RepID=A0A5B7C0T3_DAVIN